MSLLSETIIFMADVPVYVPLHGGRSVTTPCVRNWIRRGIGTPAGRIRLEAARMGGRWITSREALERFTRALTAGASPQA